MTAPYWTGDDVTVHHGDCLTVLTTMADNTIDAIVCDPPYELAFMSKRWDATGVAFNPAMWAECLRVLKPGGHMLSFGGDRTHHRMMVAIEDAGFEIRQPIIWLFGSGFPKSLDVSKAIDKATGVEREIVGAGQAFGKGSLRNRTRVEQGYRPTELMPEGGTAQVTAPATDAARQWSGWGTGLKPAAEIICVARKPLTGTVAQCVTTWGTGALNIDGCRIGYDDATLVERNEWYAKYGGIEYAPNNIYGEGLGGPIAKPNPSGRWPANVVLDESQAAALDKQSGTFAGVASGMRQVEGAVTFTVGEPINPKKFEQGVPDFGGASRFFKVFPTFRYCAKAPTTERPKQNGIAHATVKPLELIQYLVRLVTPPGGTVLDPFAGSGTTGEAALREGFKTILIEQEADYLPLILERFRRPINYIMNFNGDDAA